MTITINHIEQTPGTRGGRPRVAGTRITVDDLVVMHFHLGQPLDQIAGKYKLSLAAVHAAMAYYFDHKATSTPKSPPTTPSSRRSGRTIPQSFKTASGT